MNPLDIFHDIVRDKDASLFEKAAGMLFLLFTILCIIAFWVGIIAGAIRIVSALT